MSRRLKPPAELHRVEDADAVLHADRVRAQVGVRPPDPQLPYAPLQHRRLACEERLSVGPADRVLLRRQRPPDVRRPLLDVLAVVVADRPVAVTRDRRARLRRRLVERHQLLRHPLNHRRRRLSALDQAVQHPLLRQPPHPDGVLHDRAFSPAENERAPMLAYRHDAEVSLVAEQRVQPHLALAVVAALAQRRVVQKAEVHRLLHLVDVLVRQEHVRDVCLDQLHTLGDLWIRSRL